MEYNLGKIIDEKIELFHQRMVDSRYEATKSIPAPVPMNLRKLVEKALTDDELLNLCHDFKVAVTQGQTKDQRIRALVEYIESRREESKLLAEIEQLNPIVYKEYLAGNPGARRSPEPTRSPKHPTVSDFDLKNTIDRCVQRIRDCRRGLIGLSVCCNDHLFVQNFRKRLDEELRYRNIKVRIPISVNYKNPVERVVATVGELKKTLKSKNIVYLIKIDNSLNSKSVTTELWTEIQKVFGGVELDHSLTIVMFGDRDCIFPSDMLLLDPPRFTSIHAYNWIKAITTALGRQEEWIDVQDKWTAKITELCPCEDPDFLDMVSVYDQLDGIFSLLQQNPSISPQDFLAHLEE